MKTKQFKDLALLLLLPLIASCSSTSSQSSSIPASTSLITSTSSSVVVDDGSIFVSFKDTLIEISNDKEIEILVEENNDSMIRNGLLSFKDVSKSNFAFQVNFEVESIKVSFNKVPTNRVCIGVMNSAGFKLFNDMELDGKEASYTFAATLPTNRLILQCSEAISVSSISLVER